MIISRSRTQANQASSSLRSSARHPQYDRHRSRTRRRFTEYIRSGARALFDALNTLSVAFASIDSGISSPSVSPAIRFVREPTPEGEFFDVVEETGDAGCNQVNGDTANDPDAELQIQHPQPLVALGSQPQPPPTASGSNAADDNNVVVNGLALVPLPIARRTIRRRDGRVVTPHPPWQIPPMITVSRSLGDAPNMRPTSQRRRVPIRREGAFHERWMPIDSPERRLVAGRDPSTLYENLVWDVQWGPIPRLTDIAEDSNVRPTTQQVLDYLNQRFRFNRRAYNTALDVLFPPEGRESRDPELIGREPAFQRVAPTALWRQDSDWEGGIVPVDREWGPSQADDAADPEAEPYEPDEYEEDNMSEFTDEELLAISRHVTACLAARQGAVPISAQPSASLYASSSSSSQFTSTSLLGPSSITPSPSSPRRKRSTREHGDSRLSRKLSTSIGRPSTRRRLTSSSNSRAKASALRLDKRSKSLKWLRAKTRQNLKKAAPAGLHELSDDASLAGPSSLHTLAHARRRTRASSSSASPTRTFGAESASSRQLRPRPKRSRDEDEDRDETSSNRDDTSRRSKRSRRN
ncbi:hypothetical protein DICSQDRAFT_140387 [Dichomitus squalens LYAD-421 SS1]|uniref:Uncharacterized protein n=1 Tax=Dichomitus squalens (strain LYAD-421) TaxID=732165 RepID=R7SMG2_DICSQ|nr:uncharacterized protein DICSQDRAFT_140387 [Dichomitus squalens LYAD-421 SS1]EJF57359.1 hypothetical protein DICSQDRAFT_140387 [Dichomitus squalens LYAD-421 SS1]